MPLYSYVCKDCGETFDLLVGVTVQKTELKCRKCGSEHIEKTFGSFSMGASGSKTSGFDSSSARRACPFG